MEGEDYDDYLFQYTRYITTRVIVSSTTSMSWSSTSDKCKECSPEKLNKVRMKRNLKTLRHTRKRLLYVDKKKTTWYRTSSAQQKCGEDFL
jgi:hypothetical protein